MRCAYCHRRLIPGAACPRHPNHRAPEPDSTQSLAPTTFGGLRDFELLGRGGFATVFAATREDGGRVAVKIALQREDLRFEREAAALRQLGPPTTPALLDEGRLDDGRPWLILECLVGRSLAAWLAASPQAVPPRSEALRWFTSTCAAVERIHSAGLVHRDLKPENVFLEESGVVRILDFGLARAAGEMT